MLISSWVVSLSRGIRPFSRSQHLNADDDSGNNSPDFVAKSSIFNAEVGNTVGEYVCILREDG